MSPLSSRRSTRPSIPGLRAGIAAFATVLLVSAGSLGAYAVWSTTASKTAAVSTAAISSTLSGTSSLNVAYSGGISEFGASSLRTATGTIVVSNTGGAPLTYALTATGGTAALNSQIDVQVWQRVGATCTASTTPDAATLTSGTLGAPPALHSSISTIAAAASRTLCVRTTLKSGYTPPRTTVTTTPTLTITGTVGASWTTSATGTVTQSAQSVAYRVWQDNYNSVGIRCLSFGSAPVTTPPSGCSGTDSPLLFAAAGAAYRISSDANPARFLALTSATTVGYVTTTGNDSLWSIVPHGGRWIIQSVQDPTLCLTSAYYSTTGNVTAIAKKCDPNPDSASSLYKDSHWMFTVLP